MTLNLEAIARFSLGHFPTPLERLERLSEFLGGPEIWIKRDDCTGLAFGGNKTRKLEYLLADARAQKADAMITFGALQSNHVRQTIAACAKADLECHAILTDIVPYQDPAYRQSGNLFLDGMGNASLHIVPTADEAGKKLRDILASLEAQSKTAYVVPAGGSSPQGIFGYAAAALELGDQCKQIDVTFDAVLHATATGGTQIGLTTGFRQVDTNTDVIGINVHNPDGQRFEEKLDKLLSDVISEWKLDHRPDLRFVHGYVGDGYGLPTKAMKEAVLTTFQLEGILLDPVYTGKAMSAIFDLCRKGQFRTTDKILFIHTGGSPGLFAYQGTIHQRA